jgi:hypothetical protein
MSIVPQKFIKARQVEQIIKVLLQELEDDLEGFSIERATIDRDCGSITEFRLTIVNKAETTKNTLENY